MFHFLYIFRFYRLGTPGVFHVEKNERRILRQVWKNNIRSIIVFHCFPIYRERDL